jgi:iron complex outermembrane receptor protein
LAAYYNAVGHYPTQELRTVAVPKEIVAKSAIAGASLQNEVHGGDTLWTYGVDTYQRTWKGDVFNAATGAVLNPYMLPTAKTLDLGAYLRGERTVGAWQLSSGLRWDSFRTKADEALPQSAKLTAANRNTDGLLGGYVTARYAFTERSQLFAGVGRSYRVPTGAERYIQSSATFFGNPEIEPTANTEFDLGCRAAAGPWSFQVKGFYSDLADYIYQVKTLAGYQTYANIDAHLYGLDLKADYALGAGFKLAGGLAWQRGRKDTLPDNNTDRDLGQMSPLKTRLALDYEREIALGDAKPTVFASIEWMHGNASREVDTAAGERVLPSWDAANLRLGCHLGSWSLTAGIDNLFDATYAVANSYEWDVVAGTASNPIVVNEPGRFAYASLGYSW